MNERLKLLRKEFNLTQEEFGNRLGIKRNTVATYESGRNEPIDAVISLICREFCVREEWLRTGDGEMFKTISTYEKAYNRFGYVMENASPAKKASLSAILELMYVVPDNVWDEIVKEFENAKKED